MPDTFLHTAYSVSLKSTARRPSYGDPDHIRQTVPDRALVAGVTDDAGVSWAMSTSGLSSHHVSGARTLGTLRRCEIVAPPGAGRDIKVYTTFRGSFLIIRKRHFHTSPLMINY